MLTDQEKIQNAYNRIVSLAEPITVNMVTCEVISPGKGLSRKANGTLYCSVGSAKKIATRVAYEYYHGSTTGNDDVSHLCHNKDCIKESHLVLESHADNMARINCPGYILVARTKALIKVCGHNPPCKVVTRVKRRYIEIEGSENLSDVE
jgi:hypothetical protein